VPVLIGSESRTLLRPVAELRAGPRMLLMPDADRRPASAPSSTSPRSAAAGPEGLTKLISLFAAEAVYVEPAGPAIDPLSHAEGVTTSHSSKVQESSLRRRGEIAGMRVVIAGTVLNRLARILDVDRLVVAEEVHLPEASLHKLHEGT
jgi:hypothetical protein